MAITFDSTPLGRKELKAAMHPYDFTLRPQLVDAQMNPGYHHLIREFEKRTGIGAVLNTSFNLHGEPVVLGPAEALKAFEESGLPHLAMGHYLVSKIAKKPAAERPVAASAHR
jgi:carbamoyltransferase